LRGASHGNAHDQGDKPKVFPETLQRETPHCALLLTAHVPCQTLLIGFSVAGDEDFSKPCNFPLAARRQNA
jgi:hypothetical protein